MSGTVWSSRFIVLLGFLTLAGNASAASPDILASNNRVLMQMMSTRVDYREVGNGYLGTRTGLLDTETGPVMGIGFSLSRMHGKDNVYWQAGLDHSSGQTNYTGSLQGGTFGSYIGVSSAVLTNYEGRLGRGFEVQEDLMVTPYAEVGGHIWDRGVNYGELYTHYYYGVGLMGQYSPEPKVVLSVNALLGRTFRSHITVNGGPLMNGFAGPLGNSSLFRLGAAADYALNDQVRGNLTIEYTGFRYGMSAAYPVGGNFVAWEPDSSTRYLVLKFGLAADF